MACRTTSRSSPAHGPGSGQGVLEQHVGLASAATRRSPRNAGDSRPGRPAPPSSGIGSASASSGERPPPPGGVAGWMRRESGRSGAGTPTRRRTKSPTARLTSSSGRPREHFGWSAGADWRRTRALVGWQPRKNRSPPISISPATRTVGRRKRLRYTRPFAHQASGGGQAALRRRAPPIAARSPSTGEPATAWRCMPFMTTDVRRQRCTECAVPPTVQHQRARRQRTGHSAGDQNSRHRPVGPARTPCRKRNGDFTAPLETAR